jgi:hypothetical protein
MAQQWLDGDEIIVAASTGPPAATAKLSPRSA